MRGCILLAALFLAAAPVRADDWPAFRGATGGVSAASDVPTHVSKENVLWKIKMPGVGASSPIVASGKVFVTAYAGYGTGITKGFGGGKGGFRKGDGKGGKGGFGKGGGPADPEQKNLKLLLICLDPKSGDVAWTKEIDPALPEVNFTGMIRDHGYATHTPVSDGEAIYAFFGKSGVVAFDMSGKQLWRKNVGSSTHFMGSAASPLLYKNLLIVNAAIESKSLIALDKKTGDEVSRAKGLGTSWASPVLVNTKEGKTEVVLSLPGKIVGYDADKGTELWHCEGISSGGFDGGGGSSGAGYGGTSPTPVAKDGVVYVTGGGGFTPSTTFGVKAGGKGDVNKTHVLWRQKVGASYVSPVILGDCLCWVDGALQCLNLADGKSVHKDRLYDGRGEYVSAMAVGNHLFAMTRLNGLFVLDGSAKFAPVSRHDFEDDTSIFNASPAVSNRRLYVRSNAYLYCIGKKE